MRILSVKAIMRILSVKGSYGVRTGHGKPGKS